MASPDALICLKETPLVEEQTTLCQIYMKEQHHVSLKDFVQYHIQTTKYTNRGVLMQASYSYFTCDIKNIHSTILRVLCGRTIWHTNTVVHYIA